VTNRHPFRSPFALKNLRRRLPSPPGQLTKIGCQPIKGWFYLGSQRLTKDLAMLGFGGAPMACSPALQPANQLIVKIAHMQISGHLCPP
jgi:hypothetical protein